MTDDMSWFYTLELSEQAALLRNPHSPPPSTLVDRLAHRPGLAASWWVASEDPPRFTLAPDAAAKLDAIRTHLDRWWSTLTPDERAYIIENRRDNFDVSKYADLMHSADGGPVDDPNAVVVVTVRDNKEQTFRLPPQLRAYVEMVAEGT